jgi:hypothetical protein
VPASPLAWLCEIAVAYRDAQEAIPFAHLLEQPFSEHELFHLAPLVCLKMRGFPLSGDPLTRARDAALASYIATSDEQPEVDLDRVLLFAFCYLAAHHGLDLVEAEEVETIMRFTEDHRDDLNRLIAEVYDGA